MLREEIFPSIAVRKISGYRGVELFIRENGDEVEFVTLLRFDSMDGVRQFAGDDASKPVIFPKAERLITRMEPARDYRIAIQDGTRPLARRSLLRRRLNALATDAALPPNICVFGEADPPGKRSVCPTDGLRDVARDEANITAANIVGQ